MSVESRSYEIPVADLSESVVLQSAVDIDYLPEENILYYDILSKGSKIGEVALGYNDSAKELRIDDIYISPKHRGKKIGKAVYVAALSLPLPNGNDPRPEGYVHVTNRHSDLAELVWRSLERDGLAENVDGARRYVMR